MRPDEPASPPSVLQSIAARTGLSPKVLLPDTGSEHGASPVVAPGTAPSRGTPKGRGNYQLLGEIARGGMGVVLKGHDTDLGRDVAIKVLDGELAKSPPVVQRFVEEAQIGGQLQHPGIVPVYELGLMADDSPYFTMKLVKGRTLSAILQQRKTTGDNRGRLLAIFESVCQTVAYAHSKGVLHRDLKPANIMVGAFGEVQVVDWGLAKVLHRGGVADERRAQDSLHTVIATVRSGPGSSGSDSLAGSVMGTPAYMAPEQAQGEVEKLDERADVFSLGAILCEILTGRPPYEATAEESCVVQAARAKLDPARARLAECGADPALVKLCLECLMPARAARPANAEEVARAVRDFLTSVEERAQKAELAAMEARIRATAERRARRLTLALAATVVVALISAVGGYWWVEAERGQRVAQTRLAVETAHGESIELAQAGKFEPALLAARRALTLAETGDADDGLLARARSFVAQAELDSQAAERERALREQDERLLGRLIDLRVRHIGTLGNRPAAVELDAAYVAAFQEYGVDLEGSDLVPAMERLRERAIAEEVALALDDWNRLRRKVHGPRSEKAENLFYLAMDLDADPGRQRLRAAIEANDLEALLGLAAPGSLEQLAPGSIFVLSAALWDGFPERRPDVYRIFDRALALHPGDYVLQSVGGAIYQMIGRRESALASRTAALALRPNDPTARMRAADTWFFLGRLTEAEGAYRALVATAPGLAEAHYTLGLCRMQLGDFEQASECISRALVLQESPGWRADAMGVRYYLGRITKEELIRAIEGEVVPLNLATLMYPLLDHPDPARRDPQYVLRTLEGLATLFQDVGWSFVLETVAKVRVGDWAGALAAFETRYTPPDALILTPVAFEFVRALIYAQLGRDEAARQCYLRGMAEWGALTDADPAAWARSDAMRWRREAEAAMGS